jgi:uncharacterized membrane protein YbhN (UPF0104 family)
MNFLFPILKYLSMENKKEYYKKKLIWLFDAFTKGFAIILALVGVFVISYNLIYLIIGGEEYINKNFVLLVLTTILGFLLMIVFFFYPFVDVFIYKKGDLNNVVEKRSIIEEWKSLPPNEKKFYIELFLILTSVSLFVYIVFIKILGKVLLSYVIITIFLLILIPWRAKSLKIGKFKDKEESSKNQ